MNATVTKTAVGKKTKTTVVTEGGTFTRTSANPYRFLVVALGRTESLVRANWARATAFYAAEAANGSAHYADLLAQYGTVEQALASNQAQIAAGKYHECGWSATRINAEKMARKYSSLFANVTVIEVG